MSFEKCPGVRTIIGPPQIVMRSCPKCGEEVEFFTDETETDCPNCGHRLHQEATQSCVSWCQYAEKCIADLKDRGMIPPSRVKELEDIAKRREG
ncbi:hypothetical protein ISS96_01540 [Candidatus Bathyarchaeota archaeon]|nr:hypothetical protein [Candidatus Bathyarchaeota archaeon]